MICIKKHSDQEDLSVKIDLLYNINLYFPYDSVSTQ